MGNLFNDDFRDFTRAFESAKVRYLLIGGYAVIIHGYNRTTDDMDLWVDRAPGNYAKIVCYNDLITLKKAAGRMRDMDDLQNL